MTTNYTKRTYIVPNGRKIFQMVIKYNIILHSKAFKICPNLDFWSENKPSGNPADVYLHTVSFYLLPLSSFEFPLRQIYDERH
jgi:hypothetical protein